MAKQPDRINVTTPRGVFALTGQETAVFRCISKRANPLRSLFDLPGAKAYAARAVSRLVDVGAVQWTGDHYGWIVADSVRESVPTPHVEPRCAACRFWHKEADRDGECRRRAPVGGFASWPHVPPYQWCGEFEARPC